MIELLFSKRTWYWIAVVMGFIVIAGVLVVNWAVGQYLSPEGISSQLSGMLNRDVRVESVDFSIWSGIRLGRISISEYPDRSAGTMLEAESLSLKPRWWPLLFGNIRVNRARLVSPTLSVSRRSDGSWNLLEGPDGQSPSEPTSEQSTASTGGVSLDINRVDLVDVELRYRDETLDVERTFGATKLTLTDFTMSEGGRLTIDKANVPGGQFSADLNLKLSPWVIELNETAFTVKEPSQFSELLSGFTGINPGLTGGQISLNIPGGTIRSDRVKLDYQAELNNVSATVFGEQSIRVEQAEWQGEIEGAPAELSGSTVISALSLRGTRMPLDHPTTVSGTIDQLQFDGSIRDQTVNWSLNSSIGSLTVNRSDLTAPLTVRRAKVTGNPDQFTVSDLETELGPTLMTGTMSVSSFTTDKPTVSGQFDVRDLNLDSVLPLFPSNPLPSGVDLVGTVSSPGISVDGPLFNPSVTGRISLDDVRLSSDRLNSPLRISEQTVQLNGKHVNFEQLNLSFSDQTIPVTGRVVYRPNVSADVSAQLNRIPASVLLNSPSQPLAIPDAWRPQGTVSGQLRLTSPGSLPRVNGQFRVPELSLGPIEGRNSQFQINFSGDTLIVDPVEMDVFGGTLTGAITVNSLFNAPDISGQLSLTKARVEGLMTELAGVGRGSKGSIRSRVNFNSSLEDVLKLTGDVTLRSDSIVLKHIPALNNLDQAVIDGVSGALGEQFGPVVTQLFGQSLSKQTEELRRVFSEDVTSQFDVLRGDIAFQNGVGEIKQSEIRNQYLSIKADGQIWSDGRLKTEVSLDPRAPLVDKANQRWLKNFLRSGLPPMSVDGTVVQPQYGLKKFRSAMAKSLAEAAINNTEKSDPKEGVKDRLKQKALDELFD